jgi:hypothetical protein
VGHPFARAAVRTAGRGPLPYLPRVQYFSQEGSAPTPPRLPRQINRFDRGRRFVAELLAALAVVRRQCLVSPFPLIFICHSIGPARGRRVKTRVEVKVGVRVRVGIRVRVRVRARTRVRVRVTAFVRRAE